MKKVSSGGLLLLAAVVCIAIFACFTGLDPAKNYAGGNSATLTLSFSNIPALAGASTPDQTRAVVQGGGYLYIQIGNTAGAQLFGPYTVGSDNTITIGDLPTGTHAYFAIMYADTVQSGFAPVISANGDASEAAFRTTLAAAITAGSAVSCKLLTDVQLEAGTNTLKCTLVPLAAEAIDCSYTSSTNLLNLASDGTATAQKFIALMNLSSRPAGIYLQTLDVSITNTASTACSIQSVALYTASGALAAAAPGSATGTLAAGSTTRYLSLAGYGDGSAWVYVKYVGTGIRITTTQVWNTKLMYVTTDGQAARTIDGINWTAASTGLTSCTDLAYGASGFVACGTNSAGYVAVATSTDGYAWTMKVVDSVHTSLIAGYLGVRPSDGAMVMTYLSGATGYAATSLDGWATTNSTGISGTCSSNAYMNDGWYASASNGSSWRKTTDGLNWITAVIGSCSMYQISLREYVGGVFFVGGAYNGSGATKSVYRSTDSGATFSAPITLPCSTMSYPNEIIQTASGRLVEFGSGTDADRVCYSDNFGSNWTSVATQAAAVAFNCASATSWGVYAGTSSGLVYASTDNGISFTQVSVPTSSAIAAMSVSSY